jgi:hypothetical protein
MNSLLKQIIIKNKSINLIISRMSSQLSEKEVLFPRKCWRFRELTEEFLAQRECNNNSINNELNIEMFRELIVDKESENSVKEILDFYNSKTLKTRFYPSVITKEDMNHMLNKMQDFSERRRHLKYLFIREFDIWRNWKRKEAFRAQKLEKELMEVENFGQIGCFDAQNNIQYGFWKNSMFSRYYQKSLKNYSLNYLRNATLFGQKIVIDCSFDGEMEAFETLSAARQMARIYSINRHKSRQPFDLHFCNVNQNSRVFKNFEKMVEFPFRDKLFINCHKESYLDLFPNQRLIYLTPDAKPIMTEFDDNAIYIMGSLVGKTCDLPFTLFKARREGLEHYRLPIHLFVKLAPNVKKVLSFQGVFRTLLELKDHRDWKLAFLRGIQEHKLTTKLEDQYD